MTNPTPVAFGLQMPNEPHPRQIWIVKDDPFNAAMKRWPEAYNGAYQVSLFTSAQLRQAKADALREAIIYFGEKGIISGGYVAQDLHRMADEIEGEKK